MTKPIVHRDLLSVLSLELKQDARSIRDCLQRDPSYLNALMAQIEKLDWSSLEFVLEEPITLSEDGVPLLAKGNALTPTYIKALLGRQLKLRDKEIGPVILEASEATLRHYRQKVTDYFEAVLRRVRESGAAEVSMIHRAIDAQPELGCIHGYFRQIVDGVLSSADTISTALSVVSQKGNDTVVERGTNAALVAMVVLGAYQHFSGEDERRTSLTTMGVAALFQDVSLMLDHNQAVETHSAASAVVAEELGLEAEAVEAIRLHHLKKEECGEALLQSDVPVSAFTRILVTANAFLDMISGPSRVGGFEALKGLNYLAGRGYVDRRAVDILSRLCLPRVKSYIVEQANKIAGFCQTVEGTPVLWPITGDKIPTIFICQDPICPHVSMQVNHLARNVPFCLDGVEVATVPRGDYFTCTFLTPKLKELYDYIQSRARGGEQR
jgi:hypothetical protein